MNLVELIDFLFNRGIWRNLIFIFCLIKAALSFIIISFRVKNISKKVRF